MTVQPQSLANDSCLYSISEVLMKEVTSFQSTSIPASSYMSQADITEALEFNICLVLRVPWDILSSMESDLSHMKT